jgi:hypothetical protein
MEYKHEKKCILKDLVSKAAIQANREAMLFIPSEMGKQIMKFVKENKLSKQVALK